MPYRVIIEKYLEANQTLGFRGKNVAYLIAVLIAALFCFGGCSNESQMKQLITKPPLTDEVIEQTLEKHGDGWKRHVYSIDAETAARVKTNVYAFDDGDGFRWEISTYKKQGATYLNIHTYFPPQGGEKPGKLIEEKLPDMFAVACELYGDDIDLKEFEGFWDFYESKKGLRWRKIVGDNIIQAGKPTYVGNPASARNLESAAYVSIQKKSWDDWSSISKVKSALWENQNVSIEEHISTVEDIRENKAVPIKSCYIVKGDIVDTMDLAEIASLPDQMEILSKLNSPYQVPKTGEYHVATIKDTSGKMRIIIPAPQIIKSEFKEFKYFAVYEYTTDKGRSFYLLAMARSLNVPTF